MTFAWALAAPHWQASAFALAPPGRRTIPTIARRPGVAGKNPVPYKPDPKLPVRVRKSAFELDKTEVDRLKEAYAALRKLTHDTPDDPRGWLRGGYVHCWYCGGGNDNKAGEEIHGSWLFFPWHRAYLHFHERILCKLINDDTLAIPYWDWDSEGRQKFPSVYGDPSDTSNPLFDMLRSAKPNDAISDQAVSAAILNTTMNAPNNNLFLGSQAGDAGAMENAPHGPVHIWTGDTTLQNAQQRHGRTGDGGAGSHVLRPPWQHRQAVGRVAGPGAAQHKNFTSATWTQHPWQFYDENAVWTEIKIADVLDSVKSLRSEYAKPSAKPIWTFRPRTRPCDRGGSGRKSRGDSFLLDDERDGRSDRARRRAGNA